MRHLVRLDKAHVWRGWFFLYPLFAELNGDCSSASLLPWNLTAPAKSCTGWRRTEAREALCLLRKVCGIVPKGFDIELFASLQGGVDAAFEGSIDGVDVGCGNGR